MIARVSLFIALAVAGLAGCATDTTDAQVRFTRGDLVASDDLRVAVRLPSGRADAADVTVRRDGDALDVALFGVPMSAAPIEVDRYELRPEGHEAAAAELWDRLEAVAPFALDAEDTTGVTLDREAPILLDVQSTRMGEVEAARLSFGVLVDRPVVDRHAALLPELAEGLRVETRARGEVVPMQVVLRTPAFVDAEPSPRIALRCSSGEPDVPYDPCDGLSCGATCTLCDPADPDCVETSVIKMCQPDGSCAATVPSCASDCRTAGCGTGNECQLCWGSYQCVPRGAAC